MFDDLIDLRVAEGGAERRHRTVLAVLDAVSDKVIVAGRVHELRTPAGGAAPIGMTEAAGCCEQLLDIECVIVSRFGCRLLCRGGHGAG